jgi:hypothetical protein
LAHAHLAATKKQRCSVTLLSYWRSCPCFIGSCRLWLLVHDRWSIQRAAGCRLWHHRLLWWAGRSWPPSYALKLHPVTQVWNYSQYGGLANNVPNPLEELYEAVGFPLAANAIIQRSCSHSSGLPSSHCEKLL